MGEGLLSNGVFRQPAPNQLEINIPGLLESPTNKIIRNAYRGLRKGSSYTRTHDNKLYPTGFTPPEDFVSDPSNIDPSTGLPVEAGTKLRLSLKPRIPLSERYKTLQESSLRFFDTPSLQFRHLVEYLDNSQWDNSISAITTGESGNRPGIGTQLGENEFKPNLYLASFLKTHAENEDPTILGFDFHIRMENSPLFNGTLEEFLTKFGANNTELKNRVSMLKEFQKQFLGFFKTFDANKLGENLPSPGYMPSNRPDEGSQPSGELTSGLLKDIDRNQDMQKLYYGSAAKAYYIQGISGLNKLNEQNDYGDAGKRFVDWGKDFLTLTLNEDVSQNIGYLASLYKNLSWSRERGRMTVPENLLRFEVVIDVTEIRNYVRIYQKRLLPAPDFVGSSLDTSDWVEIADQTSKYRYFVHECQLFFPTLPHGDSLTVGSTEMLKGPEMKIYFKHSNLRFMKFKPPHTVAVQGDDYSSYNSRYRIDAGGGLSPLEDYFKVKVVDNSVAYKKPGGERLFSLRGGPATNPDETVFSDGSVNPMLRNTSPIGFPVNKFTVHRALQFNFSSSVTLSDEERRKMINMAPSFTEKLTVGVFNAFENEKKRFINAGINFINRNIVEFTSLINRSLNSILNSTPVVGGITAPKNVYTEPTEWEQAYLNFVGPGFRTFFEDPTKFQSLPTGKKGETLKQKVESDTQFGLSNANTTIQTGQFGEIDAFSNDPSRGNSADIGPNKKLKDIVDSDPSLGNGFSGASTIPYLGNSADVGNNRKLQEIVDSNPGLGRASANTSIQTALFGGIDAFSNNPAVGNSADPGVNKKLNQIVDSDPDLGNGFSGASTIPYLGNSADVGNNRTLQQIVDDNPGLGRASANTSIQTALFGGIDAFSNNPSVGNSADPGVNKKLKDIVDSDPSLGNGFSGASTIPYLGNSADTGNNSKIDDIVARDTKFGNDDASTSITLPSGAKLDAFSNIPYLGNSATPAKGSKKLKDIVDSDPSFGTDQFAGSSLGNFFSSNPVIGNSAKTTTTTLLKLDEIVKSRNDGDNNTGLGNGGEGISQIPSVGNRATPGRNVYNDKTVSEESDVRRPELGNSSLVGKNVSNNKVVSDYSKIQDPDEGNSAISGTNFPNKEIIHKNTQLQNPDEGNSAITGPNSPNSLVIQIESDLDNPDQGNKAKSSPSVRVNQTIKENTELFNPYVSNSANQDLNKSKDELILTMSNVVFPSQGNSANVELNADTDKTIKDNTEISRPFLGNKAKEGFNLSKNEIVFTNTKITDPTMANSADYGKNNTLDQISDRFGKVESPEISNQGRIATNQLKDDVVSSKTKLEDASLANRGRIGQNLSKDSVVSSKSRVDNPYTANSGQIGINTNRDQKVSENSKIENSQQGNGGFLGINTPKDFKVQSNTDLENPQIGNSGELSVNYDLNTKIKQNSFIEDSGIGNKATVGINDTSNEIIKKQSELDDPSISNKATLGKNSNLSDYMKYSNSRIYGTVDWTNIQFPKSANRFPPPTTEK